MRYPVVHLNQARLYGRGCGGVTPPGLVQSRQNLEKVGKNLTSSIVFTKQSSIFCIKFNFSRQIQYQFQLNSAKLDSTPLAIGSLWCGGIFPELKYSSFCWEIISEKTSAKNWLNLKKQWRSFLHSYLKVIWNVTAKCFLKISEILGHSFLVTLS